jgi:hypothetical protein
LGESGGLSRDFSKANAKMPQNNYANRHLFRYEPKEAMKQPRRILFAAAGGALLIGALLLPQSSSGQSDLLPPPNTLAPAQPVRPAAPVPRNAAPVPGLGGGLDDTAIASLVAEVVEQQAKLAENQKVIDEKLAIIAENLRIARIYVSRAK